MTVSGVFNSWPVTADTLKVQGTKSRGDRLAPVDPAGDLDGTGSGVCVRVTLR